jgi:hypothetical protein
MRITSSLQYNEVSTACAGQYWGWTLILCKSLEQNVFLPLKKPSYTPWPYATSDSGGHQANQSEQ